MKSEKIFHPSCINFLRIKFRKNYPEADMTTSQGNQNEKQTKQTTTTKQKQMFCIVEDFMLMNHMHYISKGRRGKKKII